MFPHWAPFVIDSQSELPGRVTCIQVANESNTCSKEGLINWRGTKRPTGRSSFSLLVWFRWVWWPDSTHNDNSLAVAPKRQQRRRASRPEQHETEDYDEVYHRQRLLRRLRFPLAYLLRRFGILSACVWIRWYVLQNIVRTAGVEFFGETVHIYSSV